MIAANYLSMTPPLIVRETPAAVYLDRAIEGITLENFWAAHLVALLLTLAATISTPTRACSAECDPTGRKARP